jgi:hypothetical protein
VQHQDHALCWSQPLEHDKQGEADAVVERDPIRGVRRGVAFFQVG